MEASADLKGLQVDGPLFFVLCTGFPPIPCCLLLELSTLFLLQEAERKGIFGRGFGGLMGGWLVDPLAFEEAEWGGGGKGLVEWVGGWGFD